MSWGDWLYDVRSLLQAQAAVDQAREEMHSWESYRGRMRQKGYSNNVRYASQNILTTAARLRDAEARLAYEQTRPREFMWRVKPEHDEPWRRISMPPRLSPWGNMTGEVNWEMVKNAQNPPSGIYGRGKYTRHRRVKRTYTRKRYTRKLGWMNPLILDPPTYGVRPMAQYSEPPRQNGQAPAARLSDDADDEALLQAAEQLGYPARNNTNNGASTSRGQTPYNSHNMRQRYYGGRPVAGAVSAETGRRRREAQLASGDDDDTYH